MNTRRLSFAAALLALGGLVAAPLAVGICAPVAAAAAKTKVKPRAKPTAAATANAVANVDGEKIIHQADSDWLSNGRTYSEQRFSPLTQINRDTVKNLGVAWEFRTYSTRGLEGTPVVSNGVMYVTAPWSKVWALDAKTGKQLWAYDPQVPGAWGRYACCDVANRGVAVWKGAVYVGTLDGRLVKLDAATGKPIWDINTIDRNRAYTITGAPRIVNGLVVIGNGGAEYDTRGYLTAYDADTGRQVWRFFVVPGNPKLPPENAAMTAAMKTWTTDGKDNWWELGGGGAPWDSMAYDPELNLLYVGTGNGDPWNRNLRSPGGGDNLYLSSILAIHADTGEMAWYYQTTPGDTWDFDSTSHMILADLKIDGAVRKVLIQAPKNGFFYVIDRETGKLISAKPFAVMNWATGIDANGRPIENPDARYKDKLAIVMPQETGGHNWQPMAFNPQTGLVYIPAADGSAIFAPETESTFVYKPRAWNTGNDFAAVTQAVLDAIKSGHPPPPAVGYIKAWDPVTQKEVWHVPMNGSWNGGLLTTAGGLVFGGGADGIFGAYDAKTGEKLWSIDLKTGILAPPMSFAVGGQQYVAVLAGWGGAGGLAAFKDPTTAISKYKTNQGRLFVFALGGRKDVAPLSPEGAPPSEPPPQTADAATIAKGFDAYHRNCVVCHGFFAQSEGVIPDLREAPIEIWSQYDDIVLGGALADGGMASFKDVLSKDDVTAIRAYVLDQAHQAWDAKQKGK